MRGDGHTAYPGNSACINTAIETYINDTALPPTASYCQQETTFPAPQPRTTAENAAPGDTRPYTRYAHRGLPSSRAEAREFG
jgi:hypothetical protein